MMKYKFTASVIFFVFILAIISCNNTVKKPEKETLQQEAALTVVSIDGMSCTGCEQTIQTNIAKLDGIKSVKASYKVGNAIVEYFPDKVDTIKIKEAVTGSGYIVKKFTALQPEEAAK
jgi:copper chaperone CopZ